MGIGGSDPSENSQSYRIFFSNTGPDPLKNHKATKPTFNVGPSSVSLAFLWRANDGLLLGVFESSLPSSTKNNSKKPLAVSWTPSDKISGSAHVDSACINHMGEQHRL